METLSSFQETSSFVERLWMNWNEGGNENVSHGSLEEFAQGVNDDLGSFLGNLEDGSFSLGEAVPGDDASNASWLGNLSLQETEPPLVLERLPIELDLERDDDVSLDRLDMEDDSTDQESEDEDEASLDEQSQAPTIVLNPQDVLCNRGGECVNHPGNRFWWHLVLDRRHRYVTLPRNDHMRKTAIAMEIIAIIHQEGGLFVHRDRYTRELNELSEKDAVEKCKMGLRDSYIPLFAR